MVLPGGAQKCDNCDDLYCEVNGLHTEDGKYRACSTECLAQLEEDLAAADEARREQTAYYYATRGV